MTNKIRNFVEKIILKWRLTLTIDIYNIALHFQAKFNPKQNINQ